VGALHQPGARAARRGDRRRHRRHAHHHRVRGDDYIAAYVSHVSRLVDAVGIDHVALGTYMDGIGPGAVFTSYARWPSLAAALLDRGYRPDEVGKILGGNAQRVFRRVGEAARKS
jgi:microsomal dipeptidase-like Zn-dependent dipeptidase